MIFVCCFSKDQFAENCNESDFGEFIHPTVLTKAILKIQSANISASCRHEFAVASSQGTNSEDIFVEDSDIQLLAKLLRDAKAEIFSLEEQKQQAIVHCEDGWSEARNLSVELESSKANVKALVELNVDMFHRYHDMRRKLVPEADTSLSVEPIKSEFVDCLLNDNFAEIPN